MIVRKAIFVILAVVLGSVSAFHCPSNQECRCAYDRNGGIEISCLVKNDGKFIVNIQPRQYIQVRLPISLSNKIKCQRLIALRILKNFDIDHEDF